MKNFSIVTASICLVLVSVIIKQKLTNIIVYIKNINVNAVKVVQIVPFYSDKNT